ncbi:hypothetical protein COBT_000519 [Conglomerata obtusa]
MKQPSRLEEKMLLLKSMNLNLANANTTAAIELSDHGLFGTIERTSSRKIIFIPVIGFDKIILHDIVNKFVKRGKVIMSDGWKGYESLDQHGHKHYIISRSISYQRYKNDFSIHTNTREGNWRSIKELCPSRYRNTMLILPYLNLYILKRYYCDNLVEIIINKLLML